jgi:hypothetical protein
MSSTIAVPSASASFVEQLYTRFLHRAADDGGFAYWTGKLDTGAMNAAEVSDQFMTSTEFQQDVDPMVRLYFAVFGRIPDVPGLSFWAGAMHAGLTAQQLGAGFAGGSEFQALYGALDDGAFLDKLYQIAFQRTPDAAGKAYYLEQMSHGLSRSDIVVDFSNSPELRDTMGATVKVAEQYLGVEQAAPSAAQLAAGLTSTDPVALLTRLYASDQYSGAAVPFLSRAGVVADGYIKGATVTMTTHETVDGVTRTRVETRITDARGGFDFGEHAGFGDLVQTGGIDISTGAAVNGSFRALAGSTVINPLTTLLQAIAADGKHSAVAAEALVKAKLGIDASVELGSYNPIAELAKAGSGAAAQAIALEVQAALAQVNTAMGQIGAVLSGVGVSGVDAGANAAVRALAGMIVGAAVGVDLAVASTAAELLKDAGAAAGASASQAAAIAAIAASAGTAIGNLNHAIAGAAGAPGGDAQSHLVAIAQVQVAAEAIETGMASGATAGDLSASAGATGAGALATAVAAAAAQVGDVNGDGMGDAVMPPAPAPAPEPAPNFAVTISAGGDAYLNATEATSAAALTATVTSSISTVKVSGASKADSTPLEVAATLSNGKYVFDAGAFHDGSLSLVATDVFGQTTTVGLTLDTSAPGVAVTSDALTAVAAPVVSGTAEAGATVTAVIAGATYTTTATGGAWHIDTSTDSHANVLALVINGSNSISVTAADAAGNASAAVTQTLVIDTVPLASLFTATGTTVGATSSEAGTLGLYDGVSWVSGLSAEFTASGLTRTITVAAQDTVVTANLQVVDLGGHFASATHSVVLGTAGGDAALAGTGGADFIFGFAGDDTITGGAGADVLDGGQGADVFVFNAVAEVSSDSNGAAPDFLHDFEATSDSVSVNLSGVHAFDGSMSGWGTYNAIGGGLNTYFVGIAANGNSVFTGSDAGNINIQTDSISAASDILSRVRYNLTGTSAADTIVGGGNADTIDGGDGADMITGGAGADVLDGGQGADVFVFNAVAQVSSDSNGAAPDLLHNFEATSDSVIVNLSGVHAFDGSASGWGTYNATGGGSNTYFVGIAANGNSVFTGSDAGNINIQVDSNSAASDILSRVQYNLTGTSAADTIVGGGNADTIDGGDGADVIAGGAGNDVIHLGIGADTVVVATVSSGGIDLVTGFGADDKFQTATPVTGYLYLGFVSSLTAVSHELGLDGTVDYAYGFELGDGTRYLLINGVNSLYSEAEDTLIELVGTNLSTLSIANFSIPG